MADVIKEYAIKISVEGNKAVIKEFKEIDKKIKSGTETIDKQNKALSKTNSLLWTYAKRLVGIYAIYRLFNKGISLATNFAEQGNNLSNLSSYAQISTKSLQKLGYVVKKFGGNEKTIAQSVGELNRKIYERNNWGGNPFQEFTDRWQATPEGETIEEVLLNIASIMEGYSNPKDKWNIGETAGLEASLIEFLMQGTKKVKQDLQNAPVLYSDADIEKARKAKEQMIAFNAQLDKLAKTIGGIVLTPLTDVIKELTEFLKNPKKYIAKAFSEGTKEKPSAYQTAKDNFDLKSMGQWYWKRMKDLADFSATTGKNNYLKGMDYFSKNIFGKDYGNAMALFEGVGGGIYSGLEAQANDSSISVTNNVNQYITGNNADEIAQKGADKITEITDVSINESTGIK